MAVAIEVDVKLTKKAMEDLPVNGELRRYPDDGMSGLYIEVRPSGSKAWVVVKRKTGGKASTRTIGSYPAMGLKEARLEAANAIREFSAEPIKAEDAKRNAAISLTFAEALSEYIASRELKPLTLHDYERHRDGGLLSWRDLPIASITPEMVDSHYKELVKTSKARANGAMRVFRAVYNYQYRIRLDADRKPILPANPINTLSDSKLWAKVKRKKSIVRAAGMAEMWSAIKLMRVEYSHDHAETFSLYAAVMLFTGLRGGELRRLCRTRKQALSRKGDAKGYYDFDEKLIYFFDQKNGTEQEVPVSTYVHDLIAALPDYGDGWLFSLNGGRVTYHKARYAIDWLKAKTGSAIIGGDFRRTFITVAEGLDLSPYTYKRLVGHRINEDRDVTGGYLAAENDRIRRAAQQIGDVIARNAGLIAPISR